MEGIKCARSRIILHILLLTSLFYIYIYTHRSPDPLKSPLSPEQISTCAQGDPPGDLTGNLCSPAQEALSSARTCSLDPLPWQIGLSSDEKEGMEWDERNAEMRIPFRNSMRPRC